MQEKLSFALVVADRRAELPELLSGARLLADRVYLAFAGDRADAAGADAAYYLGGADTFINSIPAVDALVRELRPDLVLCAPTRNGRLAAAAAAAALKTGVLSDCMELNVEEGQVVGKRMVYGGAAVRTQRLPVGRAVACPAPGCFPVSDLGPAESVSDVSAGAPAVRLLEKRPKPPQTRNIAAAKNVVGVGRGFGSADALKMAEELAAAIGGEVGCSRPVAEENKWLPRELNIGISGATIKPNLYIACGISGQIQHMVGVNQARVVAAVNKDENAPVFAGCDYGIVGDLNAVLPELIKKFAEQG